jgi:hypothetical protein
MLEPDSADYGEYSGENSNLFSHVVAESGIISFDWSWNWDVDACCSGANFYVNSTLYNLIDGYPGNPENYVGNGSGTFSIAVNAGDTISFAAYSADSCCEAATLTISNFNAGTGAVPEPTSALFVGAGLTGLVALLRRRKRTTAL